MGLEEFKSRLSSDAMKEYMVAIGCNDYVHLDDEFLFKLLDVEADGKVNCQEIVQGMLKLRGTASALMLASVQHDIRSIHERLQTLETNTDMLPFGFENIDGSNSGSSSWGDDPDDGNNSDAMSI